MPQTALNAVMTSITWSFPVPNFTTVHIGPVRVKVSLVSAVRLVLGQRLYHL